MPSAVSAGRSDAARATTLEGLRLGSAVATTFQDTQSTLSTHRKNTVALFKLHQAASNFTEATPRGTKLVGEKAFNEAFLACLNRCLDIKKGVVNADRSIKFVAAYSACECKAAHLARWKEHRGASRALSSQNHAAAISAYADAQQQFRAAARTAAGLDAAVPPSEDEEEEDTAGTRFVTILLKHLLRGFGAKSKSVRLRCCQSVALLINGLESIDDDLYDTLKGALLLRARDKESFVRVQAVVALAKLQGGEDDGEAAHSHHPEGSDEESRGDITGVLLKVLRHDPSAYVAVRLALLAPA